MWVQNIIANMDVGEIVNATSETLYMLSISTIGSAFIGIFLGIILYITHNKILIAQYSSFAACCNKIIYIIVSFCVNILRSVPFIILLIFLMPLGDALVGVSIGTNGMLLPLIIGASPFFAKLIENALYGIDNGILRMAISCGASLRSIIWHILLPEILPHIISSIALTAIALISYTAMAGTIGGGGLGDLAIRYGYQRFQMDIMVITIIILIIMVQSIQITNNIILKFLRK